MEWNTLVDLDEPGQEILTAWIAKEELRALLALARTLRPLRRLPPALPVLHLMRRLRHPRTARLATTISTWWPAIETSLRTGITNAKSEGYNRVIKLEARNAYGYRNPANQRL